MELEIQQIEVAFYAIKEEQLRQRDEIFEEQLWLRERARRCHNGNTG